MSVWQHHYRHPQFAEQKGVGCRLGGKSGVDWDADGMTDPRGRAQQDRLLPADGPLQSSSHLAQKVLLYWNQATADGKSHKSDKAIIESITDKPLRVFFPDDDVEIKTAMIAGRDNPFTVGFLVDVEVQTIKGGEPFAYKIELQRRAPASVCVP
jgi:hypothetical protein